MLPEPNHIEWERMLEAVLEAYVSASTEEARQKAVQAGKALGVDEGDLIRWTRKRPRAQQAQPAPAPMDFSYMGLGYEVS